MSRNSVPIERFEGQLFGGLVLAAFVLYGVGSALTDAPTGLTLVALNSVAVAVIGVIGFRLLRTDHRSVGVVYMLTRIVEAALLLGGRVLDDHLNVADADDVGYLLAMVVLGFGSLPFWCLVGRRNWIPRRLAWWGIAGYVLLGIGAVVELTTTQAIAITAGIPGGLFEITVGVYLLRKSFSPTIQAAAR